MGIAKWAAATVTFLMGLANLGLIAQSNVGLRVLGTVLALAAALALVGFVTGRSWGANAVITVGAANSLAAIAGAIAGLDGWPLGLVLSVLAVVLAAVSRPAVSRAVTP